MIIFNDDRTIAVNSDKVLYYKIAEDAGKHVLQACFSKDESVLIAKGTQEELRKLIAGIAQKSNHAPIMEV